ncbi:MAG: gas vesicle protein GvpO [Pseudomonadota bacterium]
MVEHPGKGSFANTGKNELTLPDAVAKARLAMGAITQAPVDSVKSCSRGADAVWTATVEVVESVARMGDNDLLSAYQIVMNSAGDLMEFKRVGRYHREDAQAS